MSVCDLPKVEKIARLANLNFVLRNLPKLTAQVRNLWKPQSGWPVRPKVNFQTSRYRPYGCGSPNARFPSRERAAKLGGFLLRRARILLFRFLRQIAHKNLGDCTTWAEIAQELRRPPNFFPTNRGNQKAVKSPSFPIRRHNENTSPGFDGHMLISNGYGDNLTAGTNLRLIPLQP